MKLKIKEGTTSKIVTVFIQDSSNTTGAGLAGLVFNSASLTGYWIAEGDATATAITLATMTAGTWATGGFVEVDATNLPGVYQVGLPDVVVDATSEGSVVVMLKGATNMAPCLMEIELDAIDYRAGVVPTVTTLTGHTAQTGDSFARLGAPAGASISVDIADVPTVAEFNARTLVAASYFDPAADTVANVTTVATLTGHTAQTGDTFALANGAAGFVAIDTVVDSILANVATAQADLDIITGADGVNLLSATQATIDDIPTTAEFEARTLVAASYFDPAADTVANVTTVATTTTNTDMLTAAAILTTQMTEAYAADGVAPTLAQALFLIQQALTEVSISSTTETIKKLDGSTAAATLTLDSATAPTSKTRAT